MNTYVRPVFILYIGKTLKSIQDHSQSWVCVSTYTITRDIFQCVPHRKHA